MPAREGKKIDIYVSRRYVCSTIATSTAGAKARFLEDPSYTTIAADGEVVRVRLSNVHKSDVVCKLAA